MNENHEAFIRETIRLAEEAKRNGNHPFGSILVHNGEIILRAQNTVITDNDITQHAETVLVRDSVSKYSREFLTECTLYTSTEPCPMCTGAIFWSGIRRIVFACSAEKLAEFASDNLRMNCREILARGDHKVDVIGPVLEDEAATVHAGFRDNL